MSPISPSRIQQTILWIRHELITISRETYIRVRRNGEKRGTSPHNSNDKGLEINERINLDYRLSTNHSLNLNTLFNYARRQPSDNIASQHAGFVIGGFPSKRTSVVSGLTWEAKLFDKKLTNMLSAKYFHLHSEIEDLTSYEMIEAPKKKNNTTSQIGWIEAIKYEPFRGFI